MPSKEQTNILLTGASGFLGKELASILGTNHQIDTLGRVKENHIIADLSIAPPNLSQNYDWVIHNAGKAHVIPKNKQEEEAFYQVNYQGTIHLLKALDKLPQLPTAFIFISTIAVYGLDEGSEIMETHPLNATEPYGKSKIMAEAAIQGWGAKHGLTVGILRLPLVAGPRPLGNLEKMIGAMQKGYFFQIAGGKARKSMVVAKDIAAIIPKLAQIGGIFNLSDGIHPSFEELGSVFAQKLGVKKPFSIPTPIAKLMAFTGDIGSSLLSKNLPFGKRAMLKMTCPLTVSDQKARQQLQWNPQSVIDYLQSLPKDSLTK